MTAGELLAGPMVATMVVRRMFVSAGLERNMTVFMGNELSRFLALASASA
jgi:hypothetical protein